MRPNCGYAESVTKPTSKSASDSLPPPIVITAGEPAGIGPELCLALQGTALAQRAVVVADPETLRERAQRLQKPCALTLIEPDGPLPAADAKAIRVWPQPLPHPTVCGTPNVENSPAILNGLAAALRACMSGRYAALVTGPLQKSAIIDAGIAFSGHTEFLAAATDTPLPVMLLVAKDLRVALVTTHLPLSAVPGEISKQRIVSTLRVLHRGLGAQFGIAQPRIVVCGLNPHAGEGGHLGREDAEIIEPAIALCRAESIDAVGPVPADTAFTPAAGPADAVLAMYHDQGLPVLKYAGFGHSVNVTLGLPIIRTSVDHGTALDIAGLGRADSGSFITAIELALELATKGARS